MATNTASNGNGNATWRNWALGVTATIIATLVVQGLAFQREMRSAIDINEQRIKALESDKRLDRARDALIRELAVRDETVRKLERRLELLEQRMK